MKKSYLVILVVLLICISVTATFFVTTMMQVNIGDKVVINRSELNQYRELLNQYSEIEELKNYIKSNYYKEISDQALYEGMKKGVFEALEDPYSVFMDSEEFTSYQQSSSGEYPGIGIYLSPNENEQIEIVAPIEDTPAYEAGLLANDIIVGVNGIDYGAEQMEEAISVIKGEPGTPVTLKIYRPSSKKTFDVEIIRAWIDIKVVKSRMIESGIGYLRLTMFDEHSAAEFETHMNQLLKEGAKDVIIDLRQNPGGYLSQAVEIADMLLGKELIVYTEGRNGDNEKYYSDASKYNVNLVVLIDGGSASASEILTGALKDYKSATIIGTTSFGKGVVQIVKPYKEDTGFKLTTSEYFTPNGTNIHGIGINPDIEIAMNESYYEKKDRSDEDDNQLQRAIEFIKTGK